MFFLLPVCEGVVITRYNDPLVGFPISKKIYISNRWCSF